jgi:hypothetical protein
MGTFFPAKEGVHSRNTFFILYMGHFSPEKGHFFTFEKSGGGGHIPPLPPGSTAPAMNKPEISNIETIVIFVIFVVAITK